MAKQHETRLVRLVCILKENVADKLPLTLEVALQKQSIAKGRVYFGFHGLLSGELYPFILRPDGRLDYGSGYEDDDNRYVEINIFDKKIEKAAIFTTVERDEQSDKFREHVYLIKEIVEL